MASAAMGGNSSSPSSINDPFNYPMPNRRDLMSLNTIDRELDGCKTNVRQFNSIRATSSNLITDDIQGM